MRSKTEPLLHVVLHCLVRLLAGTNAPPYWVDQNEPSDGRDADAEVMGRFGLQVDCETADILTPGETFPDAHGHEQRTEKDVH